MSDRASSPTRPPAPEIREEEPETRVQVKEEEALTLPSPTSSVARTEAVNAETNPEPPSSSPSRSIRRTQAQRRAFLRDDPLVQEAESHRVLCRTCQRWIRLAMHSEYSLTNWLAHKQRCGHNSTPAPPSIRRTPSKPSFSLGSRVATAERKIVLLNDPQVRGCSPGHVQCGTCKSAVALDGEVDYDLTKWTEHKEKCIPMAPAPITPQAQGPDRPRAFPPRSSSSTHSHVSAPRSPTPVGEDPSSNSTETTAVTEPSPASAKIGEKRGREEEEEEEEKSSEATEERPTNRARTETYKPPEGEAASLLGWLMQPLKEFARGFREGLGTI